MYHIIHDTVVLTLLSLVLCSHSDIPCLFLLGKDIASLWQAAQLVAHIPKSFATCFPYKIVIN